MDKKVTYKEPKGYFTPEMKKAYENSLTQHAAAKKQTTTKKK